MFTVKQIEDAHEKVKTGAGFPNYIQEIKGFGVKSFETFVNDSHTVYFGNDNFQTSSNAQYEALTIVEKTDKITFVERLKNHQKGETDYFTFCKDCAENGIEKWKVDLSAMTCIYYDLAGNEVLVENIPSV